jgi:hypothetical protein
MGTTISAIYLKTEASKEVLKFFQEYLRRSGDVVTQSADEVSDKIYGDEFINSEEAPPTAFALGAEPGWKKIYYNSFFECNELLQKLSGDLNCLAVLVKAQTVSSSYHLTIYLDGHRIRILEFADDEWKKDDGDPLPFETQPLGHNIGSIEEPFYIFDEDDLTSYCRNLGFNIWGDSEDGWVLLSLAC